VNQLYQERIKKMVKENWSSLVEFETNVKKTTSASKKAELDTVEPLQST
jgi:hypothetical protein